MPPVEFAPRARTGIIRGARPRFIVTIAHLRPMPGTCAFCGAPRTLLYPDVPEGQRGAADQEAPDMSQLGGLMRYILPTANRHGCGRCELLGHLGRLFPQRGPTAAGIESPTEATIRELRAALTPAPPSSPGWTPPADARFDVGQVFISEAAGVNLETLFGKGLIFQGFNVAGVADLGRALVGPVLDRHVRGDHGIHGRLDQGDPDRAAELGPLAGHVDQAALAVRSGRGTIRSSYALERLERRPDGWGGLGPPQVAERVAIRVWSELGPGGSVTLIYSDVDGVDQ